MEAHIFSCVTAQDFYKQGKQFQEAAWRCFGQKNSDIISEQGFHQLPSPCVVNSAFACEMFLKSMLIQLEIPYDRNKEGHSLYLLFCKLPKDKQEILAKFCSKDLSTFQILLQKHDKDFVHVRYYIEESGWYEMSPFTMLSLGQNLSSIVGYLLSVDKSKGLL